MTPSSKFQGQQPSAMEIPHDLFLNTHENLKSFLIVIDPWNFRMLFLQYPWKIHALNPTPVCCLDFLGMLYLSA